MSTPLISVIIPTYNRMCKVVDAVVSVLAQTFSDYELIIVDDASTDETVSLLHEKYDTVPSVTIVSLTENRGVSHARNCGLKKAIGQWIAFLDSDDIWHRDKLARQLQYIADHPKIKILQTQEIWIRDGVRVNAPKTHRKRAGDIFSVSLKRCMITPSSVMIHHSLFEQYGTFNEAYPACEDYDLWLRISAFEPVGLVDEMLMTRYGGAEDQLSCTVQLQDIYRIDAIKNLIDEGTLPADKHALALKTMLKKCAILANGALKRGNSERHAFYTALIDSYTTDK